MKKSAHSLSSIVLAATTALLLTGCSWWNDPCCGDPCYDACMPCPRPVCAPEPCCPEPSCQPRSCCAPVADGCDKSWDYCTPSRCY